MKRISGQYGYNDSVKNHVDYSSSLLLFLSSHDLLHTNASQQILYEMESQRSYNHLKW